MIKILALFVALIAVPAAVSAQPVPTVIPVQGILTNAQDEPVNANVAMTFTIYDAADASLFTETIPVDVENGFYSIKLGGTQALPAAAFRNGEAVTLGIKVGSDAEMAPRLDFGSVPYALMAGAAAEAAHALDADTATFAENVADGAIVTANLADEAVTQAKLAGATQVYKITNISCEQEPGTLTTSPTCHAWQFNVDSCSNSCPVFQTRRRDCNGNCSCGSSLIACVIGQPCPPSRGPSCPNTAAGYIVGP